MYIIYSWIWDLRFELVSTDKSLKASFGIYNVSLVSSVSHFLKGCSVRWHRHCKTQHSELKIRGLALTHGEDETSHLSLCIVLPHKSSTWFIACVFLCTFALTSFSHCSVFSSMYLWNLTFYHVTSSISPAKPISPLVIALTLIQVQWDRVRPASLSTRFLHSSLSLCHFSPSPN